MSTMRSLLLVAAVATITALPARASDTSSPYAEGYHTYSNEWADTEMFRAPTPAGPGAPTPGPGPQQVPLDGGLTLLALAGAGYAGKKLRDRRRG